MLEKEEVRQFSRAMMKVLKEDAQWDEAKFEANFEKLDKNHDGGVSRAELLASLYE